MGRRLEILGYRVGEQEDRSFEAATDLKIQSNRRTVLNTVNFSEMGFT